MPTKDCPRCNSPMTLLYTYVKGFRGTKRKPHRWICPKCSHSEPWSKHTRPT